CSQYCKSWNELHTIADVVIRPWPPHRNEDRNATVRHGLHVERHGDPQQQCGPESSLEENNDGSPQQQSRHPQDLQNPGCEALLAFEDSSCREIHLPGFKEVVKRRLQIVATGMRRETGNSRLLFDRLCRVRSIGKLQWIAINGSVIAQPDGGSDCSDNYEL